MTVGCQPHILSLAYFNSQFWSFALPLGVLSSYLLAMPRAPLLTGKNGNFKWVGVPLSHFSALSTWRLTVLLFICVQTGSIQCFLCTGGRCGSRNHTRFDSLLLVFKTSPLPLGLISHHQVRAFSKQNHMRAFFLQYLLHFLKYCQQYVLFVPNYSYYQ